MPTFNPCPCIGFRQVFDTLHNLETACTVTLHATFGRHFLRSATTLCPCHEPPTRALSAPRSRFPDPNNMQRQQGNFV